MIINCLKGSGKRFSVNAMRYMMKQCYITTAVFGIIISNVMEKTLHSLHSLSTLRKKVCRN